MLPPPLVEVNEGKIAELQNRIEQLQREQLIAQNALAQQSRVLAGGATEAVSAAPSAASGTERPEDPIAAERKKRGYLSLFASNVALSYRKTPTVPAPPIDLRAGYPWHSPFAIRGCIAFASPEADRASRSIRCLPASSFRSSTSIEPPPWNLIGAKGGAASGGGVQRTGARHRKILRLFEGTVLETVLVNRLDGQFYRSHRMPYHHRYLLP